MAGQRCLLQLKPDPLGGMIQRSANLIVLAAGVLALGACGDLERVESRYANLADAQADRAVERGYVPPWLPEATREIRIVGDLDTGWFAMSFTVPQPKEFASILEAHGFRAISGQPPSAPTRIRSWDPAPDPARRQGYRGAHYHDGDPVVVILDPDSGVVQYWRD